MFVKIPIIENRKNHVSTLVPNGDYCANPLTEPSGVCPHPLCPHIMENLDDLRRDPDFIDAVENVDVLLMYHTATLLHLNYIGFPDERAMRIAPTSAPYNHGDSCVKTDYNEVIKRGRKPCPA